MLDRNERSTVSPRVLVADPPWPFGDKLPGAGRGATKHYKTMTIRDIEDFEYPALQRDAVLFLWRVASMQEEALRVMRCWGFTPKSELVWCKLTKNLRRHFGMGRYVRMEHEVCLIGVRGKCFPWDKGVRSVFTAPVGEHSAKPDAFYEIVERLYPGGPFHELFARRRREGWTQEGDEL